MALTAQKALSRAETEADKLFYQGKIEGAKFFVNRISSLVPAKCEILSREETSAMRISEESFAV